METAKNEPDRELGSLDATHLATASALGEDLDARVSYDDRPLKAAIDAGLAAAFPGTDRRESYGPDPGPARLSRWRYRKVKSTLQIVDRPESQGPGQLTDLTSWMLKVSD